MRSRVRRRPQVVSKTPILAETFRRRIRGRITVVAGVSVDSMRSLQHQRQILDGATRRKLGVGIFGLVGIHRGCDRDWERYSCHG